MLLKQKHKLDKGSCNAESEAGKVKNHSTAVLQAHIHIMTVLQT